MTTKLAEFVLSSIVCGSAAAVSPDAIVPEHVRKEVCPGAPDVVGLRNQLSAASWAVNESFKHCNSQL